jgi:hypothetical protein
MFLNLPRLLPFMLQANNGVQYFKEDDPRAALILVIGLGAAITIGVVISLVRYGMAKAGIDLSSSRSPKRFSALALRRAARHYGLTGEQIRLLETIFRNNEVTDPQRVLQTPSTLDRHFKQAYRVMKRGGGAKNDGEVQERLSRLFATRIAIESSPFDSTADSLPKITERSAAILKVGGKNYPVTVLGSHDRQITIDCPVNALGTPLSLPKGSRAALSLFIDATQGFASAAEVLQTVRNAKGSPVIELELKGKPETLVKRKSRRREIVLPCEMHLIIVNKSGGKTLTTVDPRAYNGDIQDISTGGCSIRTRGVLNPAARIKISFDHRDGTVAVLGQILRINRGASINTVIHVKFTKVPLKAMNLINAIVYEYSEA